MTTMKTTNQEFKRNAMGTQIKHDSHVEKETDYNNIAEIETTEHDNNFENNSHIRTETDNINDIHVL